MEFELKVAIGRGLKRYLVPAVKVMPAALGVSFDAKKELCTVVACYLDIHTWY